MNFLSNIKISCILPSKYGYIFHSLEIFVNWDVFLNFYGLGFVLLGFTGYFIRQTPHFNPHFIS